MLSNCLFETKASEEFPCAANRETGEAEQGIAIEEHGITAAHYCASSRSEGDTVCRAIVAILAAFMPAAPPCHLRR
jgi:hypothetical protein